MSFLYLCLTRPRALIGKFNTWKRNEEQAQNVNRYRRTYVYKDAAFAMINLAVIFVLSFGLIIIKLTDCIPLRMRNMTNYCNDPQYNMHFEPRPNKDIGYFAVSLAFKIVFIATIFQYITQNRNKEKAWLKILKEFVSLSIHILLFCILVETAKLMFGVPSPYYFKNEDLYNLHCLNPPVVSKTEDEIKALEKYLRTSFPSFRAAVFGYCTTFLSLYVYHYHISFLLNTAQQLTIYIFAFVSVHIMLSDVENREFHMYDLTVGGILGICYGIITIRNIFGKMFSKISMVGLVSKKKLKKKHFFNKNQADSTTAQS